MRHNVPVTTPAPTSSSPPDPGRPGSDRPGLGRRALGLVDAMEVPRPRTAVAALAVMCVMVLGGSLLPVPYVVERPGPAIDVLGEYEDEEILTIEGAETYPTDGTLMMTTVSVDGGPGYRVTPVEVVVGWFDSSQAVFPRELLFPEEQTREQTDLSNAVQMSTSQQASIAVALDELGIAYEDTVMVAGVGAGTPAEGVLEPGDVLLAVDGEEAVDVAGFQALVADREPGDPAELTVLRDGEQTVLEVPTEEADGAPRMGVVLAPGYEFPMDVRLSVGEVGGPSAGMMFSLAVYDELTPGALTGGESIAGTGTIDAEGTVGPIGGIRQKMVGAREQGAEYFLAPADNCDEVAGNAPEGLAVVAVADYDDALEAVATIAESGSTDSLPTCEDR